MSPKKSRGRTEPSEPEVVDTVGVVAAEEQVAVSAPGRSSLATRDAAGRPVAKALDEDETEADEAAESDPQDDEDDGESDPDDDAALEADAALVEGEDDGLLDAASERALVLAERSAASAGGGALSISDPLAAYMREVQRHPLLNREEEHQLAVLYHETGDVEAAKKLVTSNLRLVVKIAYEYKRAYKNMMDLVQEGNIGLMQAVKRFDPNRGVKLSSYSAWWIRAYILRFILNNWRLVKLGTTQAQRKLFFNLNKERARLAAMGIEPTHEQIAKRLEVSEKEVRQMDLRLSAADTSLDVPVGDAEGRQTTRLDLLPSKSDGPEQLVQDAQLLSMISENLNTFRETLAGKELEIFDKRMIAEEPLTLQQLGDVFGVSRERVRQLEARVAGRLRTFLQQCLGETSDVAQS